MRFFDRLRAIMVKSFNNYSTAFTCLCLLAAGGVVCAAEPTTESLAFFEKKIRPVLLEHCYKCHSASSEKVKGGLLLDTRDGIRKGGESGHAVVPGDLKESLLISALKHDDFEMPPKKMLPAAVIADFEKWIQDGAADPRRATHLVAKPDSIDIEAGRKHWAYQPLRTPAIPEVTDVAWPANDIDRFILARLESAGLQPGADAKKITLVRRLYFDLIGLPPTPEEIARFVDDKSPKAYENIVDRLMKSQRFGERWGRHWLDVVRYAESMSLRSRLLKHAWRYRDYVIEAFNDDLPYDQFLTQQLAGDLLEASSVDAQRQNLIATTFLVMGDALLENQNKSQLDMDVVDEQLDVIGKGLLAQTITCARCHDHKFDPIPTSDYYAMAGILKNVQGLKHSNVSTTMEIPLPITEEVKRALEIHNLSVSRLQSEINTLKPKVTGNGLPPVQAKDLPGIVVDNTDAKATGKWAKSSGVPNHVGSEYLYSNTSGSKVIYPVKFSKGGKYEVRISGAQHPNRAPKALVTVLHNGGSKSFRIDQRKAPGTFNKDRSDDYFQSLGVFEFPSGQWDAIEISTKGGGGFVVADAVQFLPVDNDGKVTNPHISQPVKKFSAAEQQALKTRMAKLTAEHSALKKRKPVPEMVNSAVEKKKPTDLKIHIRGSIDHLGAIAPRGVLQVANYGSAPEMPNSSSGRLELAQWIVDPANPLTSRVMANRVWHWLFGAGLVRTVDNFGTIGESPSHPKLLDHLAVNFIQQGWSVKKLIHTIVLSRTYRLSTSRGEQSKDPENRLLAHTNRRRLDAESLRDTMLSVGGTLKLEMGGATFPANLKTDVGFRFQSPRRSVYVPVFRSSLPEFFEVFDFANPSLVTGRRDVSTVAPQALFMMNHAFVRSQAKLTAERLLRESQLKEANRIDHAYLQILGRHATEAEVSLSQEFLKAVIDTTEKGQVEAWTQMVQSLFSTIDFRYLR
ncbi:DUF1553 domain-containing protein [Verrucomicrobiales bacterium]|nr:DUF1553 domain-containing protein [Verrucomicrobiales bacterium]